MAMSRSHDQSHDRSHGPARARGRAWGVVLLCLVLLAAGVVAGVTWANQRWKGSVTLLANWTGDEKERFRERVLAPFEEKYRIRVVYQGSSAQSQVLAADVAAGTPPDVAILPGPGELAAYARAGRLVALDGLFGEGYFDRTWVPRVEGADEKARTYWVPVKADLKSMVWYPGTLEEDEVAGVARQPGAWCVALESGATSGWPGTDWVEDILLQQAGAEVYEKWATGQLPWDDDRVRKAWTTWGGLVGAGDPQRVERMLMTPFQRAWDAEGTSRPACSGERLEHQATFVRGAAHWKTVHGQFVHSAKVIPDALADGNAWEVSGDLAALLRDTPEARQLMRHLAAPSTEPLGFTANRSVPPEAYDGDATERRIDATLRGPRAVRCWDASDAMPPAVRDAFHRAVLRFLAFPGQLDAQLAALETARLRKGQTWLPTVCGAR